MMVDVFLLLGSNLGNRQNYLAEAIIKLSDIVGRIKAQSSVYETQSWGQSDLPDYLNQVLLVGTGLKPKEVLTAILKIEKVLGRERNVKWGSRTIDIDILFYGDRIISEPGLTIPHPYLHLRRFTIDPLAELAPGFTHPVLGLTIAELKNSLTDNLIVKKL